MLFSGQVGLIRASDEKAWGEWMKESGVEDMCVWTGSIDGEGVVFTLTGPLVGFLLLFYKCSNL